MNSRGQLPESWPRAIAVLLLFAADAGSSLRGAEPGQTDGIVALPPFVVEEPAGVNWIFATVPGFELLSQLPPGQTEQFLRDYDRFYRLLDLLCPPEMRIKSDVPEKILLYGANTELRTVQQLAAEIEKVGGAAREASKDFTFAARRFAPGLLLRDSDASGLFVILPEQRPMLLNPMTGLPATIESINRPLTLSLSQLHVLLESRTPRPPPWFIDGILHLYQNAIFTTYSLVLSPLVWMTPEDTKRVKKSFDSTRAVVSRVATEGAVLELASRELLPLEDLFAGPRRNENAETAARRRSEAALFIRWCLEDKRPARRTALWTFVTEAAAKPPDREMFRNAFHLSPTEVLESLGDYFPNAIQKRLELRPSTPLPSLAVRFRSPAPAELARIKGDWQRLEISFVRSSFPEFAPEYVAEAGRTLLRAFDDGERDPNLLAVIGLYKCDIGDYPAARPFLESAAAAKVLRPRVYVELVRLLLAEALASPEARLDDARAAKITGLLDLARSQSPPQIGTYLLFSQVFVHRLAASNQDEARILEEGLRLFPTDSRLRKAVAGLKRQP